MSSQPSVTDDSPTTLPGLHEPHTEAPAENSMKLPTRLGRFAIPALPSQAELHHGHWLHARLQEYPNGDDIHGLITGEAHFLEICQQYLDFASYEPQEHEDPTMPSTDEGKVQYVQNLLNAIVDFSNVEETRGISPTNTSTVLEKLEKVVGARILIVELDLICWKTLVALFCRIEPCFRH